MDRLVRMKMKGSRSVFTWIGRAETLEIKYMPLLGDSYVTFETLTDTGIGRISTPMREVASLTFDVCGEIGLVSKMY